MDAAGETEAALAAKFQVLFPHLDERQRRHTWDAQKHPETTIPARTGKKIPGAPSAAPHLLRHHAAQAKP